MKTYSISFKYSKNGGKTWSSTTKNFKAESDTGAIKQAETFAPDVKEIKIMNIR